MAYTNIDDPSAYFQVATYNNNGSTITVTNDGNSDLQPDLIWNKQRTNGGYHGLWDSSRGTSKSLSSNVNGSEQFSSGKGITSFNTDGFTGVEGSWAEFNQSSQTSVAWQWKANGGTTASNTSGSTTTTVQANQDAGFSILTWTGNGATTTLGHGLGVKPDVIIVKARGTTSNWAVYHKAAGPAVSQASYNVATYLNLTDATGIASNSWGTAASDINSNTFYLKYWFNISSQLVAYCFAEKQGYSKFGSYVGNGNVNGPMVYLGFKPAVIILKRSDSATGGNWHIIDNKRSASGGANVNVYSLFPNLSDAESTGEAESTYGIDFLSNGFKIRASHSTRNASGGSYIYMAFAEHPFTTSTGIPTTAR